MGNITFDRQIPVCRAEKYRSVVPELKKTPDVKQMLHSEKVDFTRFYECKNRQKRRFIHDSASGYDRVLKQLAIGCASSGGKANICSTWKTTSQ
ncbi:MAG: hypothetical protein ACOX1F_01600 [Erysipelotrichaceae bacterium]|jgi:hypothetical protein